MLDILQNKTISGIYSIRIVEESEYFDLTDTIILELDDGIFIQILIEDGFKKLSYVNKISNIEVWGDYEPVEIILCPMTINCGTPFQVIEINTYYATNSLIEGRWQDTKKDIGDDYILGWHIKNTHQECFIRVAYEDIVIESVMNSIEFFKKCDLSFNAVSRIP